MDRFGAMQIFVRVAEAGSFSAVADHLGLARSAVTRQIAGLERHLGVKLIARSTRRLSLTQEGLVYLARCRDILDRMDRAETELAAEQQAARGLIRATMPTSFGIRHAWPLVIEFCRQHPEVSVDLDFSDRRVDLVEEGFDVGLRVTGQLPESQVARRLCVCRFVVVASPDYLRRHGEPMHPNDLRQHACLVYSLASHAQWRFEIDGAVHAIDIGGRMSADNGDALQQAAIAGMGIALQPSFLAADAIRRGELQRILVDFVVPPASIYLIFPGNRFVPQRVRQFADDLTDRLGASSGPYWDAGIFD